MEMLTPFAQAQETKPAPTKPTEKKVADQVAPDKKNDGWKDLIADRELTQWEKTNFGGEGVVEVNEDKELILDVGQPLTGITYKKDFPKENFEVRWQANRVQGSDFLVGLTFPVGEEHCSFICGGWGGGLVGISSIDGNDASENQTTQFKDIKNNQWYKFTARVDAKHIIITMDNEEIVKLPREGKSFSVRGEVRANRPFGYCVFGSKVMVKEFQYRELPK